MSEPRKDDAGKPQMRLLPWAALVEVAKVMTWAVVSKKHPYPEGNWKGVDPERYADAAQRHLAAHFDGEVQDDESPFSHLAHAACCVLFLLWQQVKGAPSEGRPRLPISVVDGKRLRRADEGAEAVESATDEGIYSRFDDGAKSVLHIRRFGEGLAIEITTRHEILQHSLESDADLRRWLEVH